MKKKKDTLYKFRHVGAQSAAEEEAPKDEAEEEFTEEEKRKLAEAKAMVQVK